MDHPEMRPDPALVAMGDQAVEQARVIARLVTAYWKQLRAEGMDDYEAMAMASEVGMKLLFDPRPNDDE